MTRAGPSAASYIVSEGERTGYGNRTIRILPAHRRILAALDRNPPKGAAKLLHDALARGVG